MLDGMQKDMFVKAKKFLDSRKDSASSSKELKEKLKEGKLVKVYMEEVDEKDQVILIEAPNNN